MRLIDADGLWEKMYKYNDNEGAKMPYGDDDSLIHKDSACFLIENAPTIEPEPHWIPCSERLPEEGYDVLVCEKNCRNIYTAYYDSAYGWITFDLCKDECFWIHLDIIAWMPLPEPYRGK